MSTTQQTPTVPAVDPNVQTAQQIADQIAAQAAPANNPQTPTPEPLERDFSVVLDTGQVYKGRTKDEVIAQLVKAQENASKRIRELSTAPAAPPPPTITPSTPQFDQNQYWQLMSTSPVEAQRYALQFTPEAQEMRKQIEQQQTVLQDWQNRIVANEFKQSAPDFPLDDDSLAKFDSVWDRMKLPMTVDNLKMVHAFCKSEGIYQPATTQATPVTPATPNPTLNTPGASSAPSGMTEQQLMQMTTADLEKHIRALQGT